MKVAILSVPYMEPMPAVAPILLSSVLKQKNIDAEAHDFAFAWYKHFIKHDYWQDIKHLLTLGIKPDNLPWSVIKQFMKFNKHYVSQFKHHDWIGLSVFTAESYDYATLLVYAIKKYCPGVKIMVGGKGIETQSGDQFHYDIWWKHGMADLIMVGDCEHTLADCVLNNTQGVYKSPPQNKQDLDAIPLASWQEYDLQDYHNYKNDISVEPYMAITASKGCVRNCTFCDVNSFWPGYIYRDPDNVAQEIITGYRNTGIKEFMFMDNLMNGSVKHYRQINQKLLDIEGHIKYGGYAIFRNRHQMPVDDFELARRAGCYWWSIGVESGSEKLRYEIGKKFTDDDLDWTAHQLAKQEIKQYWLLMVGYPSESDQDFAQTLKMIRRYESIARKGLIQISVTPTFMLLNNSPIMKNNLLSHKLGLDHNRGLEHIDKFWTSTVYPDNTFPVRADRYKQAMQVIEECGYKIQPGADIEKWNEEINNLEKVYHENKSKVTS